MGACSMVGETACVAVKFLLWDFALTGLVLPRTPQAADNGTIFNQVLSMTFETLQGSDGVDSRGVGQQSHLILHNNISEQVVVKR